MSVGLLRSVSIREMEVSSIHDSACGLLSQILLVHFKILYDTIQQGSFVDCRTALCSTAIPQVLPYSQFDSCFGPAAVG